MLKRIKYVSQFAQALSQDDVDAIAAQSEHNNREADVTGVLMASGNLFFQVLEGPAEAVDALYEKIQQDPRHRHVVLLGSEESVVERLFPDWAMKAISLEESRAARLEPLSASLEAVVELHETVEKLTATLERALWQELVYGAERLRGA
jgi:hypothetical protein